MTDKDETGSRIPKWLKEPTTVAVKPWMKLSIAALIIASLLLITMYFRTIGDADAGLYGFWEVDSNFAEKAHLDAMYLFISPPNGDASKSIGVFGTEIPIYVFLKADCVVHFNKVVKSNVSRRTLRTDSLQKYSINFGMPVSIIPEKVSAEFDPVTQMLVLRDLSKIYARLFKKPEISFYCTTNESKTKSQYKSTSPGDVDDDVGDDNNQDDAPEEMITETEQADVDDAD